MSTDVSLEDLVAQEQAASEANAAPSESPSSPASDASTPTEASSESPPDDAETPSPESGDEELSDEDAKLLQRMEELTGYQLSDRYTSSEEALRGLGHAIKLLGQRDEDAQFGRSLREKYGDQIEALLAKASNEATPPRPEAADTSLPSSYDAYEAIHEAATLRAKEPGYENDPVYQRGVEASRLLARRSFEVISQFDALQKEVTELHKQLDTQQQSSQATSAQQAEASWWQAYQGEMCQEGNWEKLTPLAKRTLQIAQSDDHCKFLMTSLGPQAALDVARAKALADQPRPKPTKPVSPHAIHQPGVAPSDHRPMTAEEVLQTDLDGEALLKALVEAEKPKT